MAEVDTGSIEVDTGSIEVDLVSTVMDAELFMVVGRVLSREIRSFLPVLEAPFRGYVPGQ